MCSLNSSPCVVTCALMCVGWILVTSALVFLTWNKVVCDLSKFKHVKYWQALLVVGTLFIFCFPKNYIRKDGCGKTGYGKRCCSERAGKGPCPYESKQPAENKAEAK